MVTASGCPTGVCGTWFGEQDRIFIVAAVAAAA